MGNGSLPKTSFKGQAYIRMSGRRPLKLSPNSGSWGLLLSAPLVFVSTHGAPLRILLFNLADCI